MNTAERQVSELKDKEIIMLIRQGDKEQFTTLMEKYYDDIFHFCYYITNDENTAYDCAQDTFFKLMKYIDSYVERNQFKQYLFQIARNSCMDFYRKNPNIFDSEEAILTNGILDERFEQTEDAQIIQEALNQLPEIQRDVIILYYFYDFKVREIARIIGTGLPTAKSRLKQGLDKLKKICRKEDFF